jgi:hypothetical protein
MTAGPTTPGGFGLRPVIICGCAAVQLTAGGWLCHLLRCPTMEG